MPVWSSADLLRYKNLGESSFVTEFPCLLDRLSLDVLNSTNKYALPDSVLSIRRVTWKGKKLHPMSGRSFRDLGSNGLNQFGTPRDYVFNNLGKNIIQLYPIPNENLPQVSDLFGTGIKTGCIVEFYSLPTTLITLPDYIRRRFLKAFTMWRAYLKEGKGQNLKAAKYYADKWTLLSTLYSERFTSIIQNSRNLVTEKCEDNYGEYHRAMAEKFWISEG